jgi:hypothetical protein
MTSLECPCGGGFLIAFSDLFRMRDEGCEARVAMKRTEIGILVHSQVVAWRESVIHGLAQQRNCLVFVSPSYQAEGRFSQSRNEAHHQDAGCRRRSMLCTSSLAP